MQKLFFILFIFLKAPCLMGQTTDYVYHALDSINSQVAATPDILGKGRAISNRAMNIFLSNKIGSFLSHSDNLSLYKNAVVLNMADGTIFVNHNLYTPTTADQRVSSLVSVGVKANALDAFNAKYQGREFSNQFGFLIKKTWIGKANTYFNAKSGSINGQVDQKKAMDALRAAMLHRLGLEIKRKISDFEQSLNDLDPVKDIPGQDLQSAKNTARKKFAADLEEEYSYRFAYLQEDAFRTTLNYRAVFVSWTSLGFYVPLINQTFRSAPKTTTPFENKSTYPFRFTISHSRLYESNKVGRFLLTLTGELYLNNSIQSYLVNRTNYPDYKKLGGTDTFQLTSISTQAFYLGNYSRFLTPSLKGQVVYIPPDWHFGLSLLLEQNFGRYHVCNTMVGVPIVLINKKAEPAFNIEFQVIFFDLTNTIGTGYFPGSKTSIGVNIGVPFSKIVY